MGLTSTRASVVIVSVAYLVDDSALTMGREIGLGATKLMSSTGDVVIRRYGFVRLRTNNDEKLRYYECAYLPSCARSRGPADLLVLSLSTSIEMEFLTFLYGALQVFF
jgi:hypothetical protein